MASIWNPAPIPIFTQYGEIASGALASFFSAGTTAPLAVYQDSSLTTPHSFPVVAASNGVFPPIYLPYVSYRVRVTDASGAVIFDADGISNPAPAAGGGGGGIVVSQDQILNTGDVKWNLFVSPQTGFVRMNARTIGSAISGATERANSDTQNLFTYLWNNLSNAVAAVSGGRGASAAADWAANKTLAIPTMQGRLQVGLDDMGGTAANAIQIIGTTDVTSGSPTIVIASPAGLARGMYMIIGSVATGQITAISGTTITLSVPYAGASAAGVSFRASFFPDAQAVGSSGGSQTATQTTAEMPAHTHTVTDPGHHHGMNFTSAYANGGAGALNGGGTNSNTFDAFTGITIANAGSGLPSSIIQPGILGCFFMKL